MSPSKVILLVESDDGLRTLLDQVLRDDGFRVESVSNIETARTAAKHRTFELLIVAQVVGNESGIEFVRALRDEGVQTRVILTSAILRDATMFFTLRNELGISRVLRRPLDPEVLLAQVRATIDPDESTQTLDLSTAHISELTGTESEGPPGLRGLLDAFTKTLPARLERFAVLLNTARAAPDDAASFADARAEAHRMHGTCGSYGFTELGRAAGAIETALDDLVAQTRGPDAVWADIDRSLAWARQSISNNASDASEHQSVQPLVLLAEDDPALVALIEKNHEGMIRLLIAGDAASAVQKARARTPDCAIIDTHLDGANGGFALARQLRDQPGLATLPIAFMSADASLKTQRAGLDAGGSIYLAKPVQIHEVLGAVESMLARADRAALKVLILDDDPDFRRLAESILSAEGCLTYSLSTGARILEEIDRTRPDILLVDKRMPGIDGLELCRILRADQRKRDLPILLVTADTSHETKVAAFAAGADDYIPKPIVPAELIARIRGRVERIALLRDRATRDSLTGLLLRSPFVEALSQAIAKSLRSELPTSVALIDLDHFKQVNDVHGHSAGDRVLSRLGALLNRRFRHEDLRCRWGGEELIVATPDSPPEAAHAAVERVLTELQAMPFESDSGATFNVSFSAGVAASPIDGTTVEQLIKAADERLYRAKRLGRGRVIG